jgi:hypothetical protein
VHKAVRITRLRRERFADLIDEHVPAGHPNPNRCPVFEDGQQFLVEGWPKSLKASAIGRGMRSGKRC